MIEGTGWTLRVSCSGFVLFALVTMGGVSYESGGGGFMTPWGIRQRFGGMAPQRHSASHHLFVVDPAGLGFVREHDY